MTADTRHTYDTFGRPARRWVACVARRHCSRWSGANRTNRTFRGAPVFCAGKTRSCTVRRRSRGRICRFRTCATGPKGRPDPLTSPTGGKAGYSDDPERFKGTFIPGKSSTPAAPAGRKKDDEGLRIESPGVPLTPAGGVLAGGALETARRRVSVVTQLDKYGVKPDDRSLERENEKYVFRASVPISGNGARRQYTGVGATAPDAVRQVIDQVASDRK